MTLPRIRITKEFSFDMAHALYGHNGPCKNIHGHTYTLRVTLIGPVREQAGDTEDGMLIDFTVLKQWVNRQIISVFDHALVLNGTSPHAELKDIRKNFEKVIFLKRQPTCENLVVHFAELLRLDLPAELNLHHLFLQETPTSWAEWYQADNL